MPTDVQTHTFPNGLTLLAERMDHVRSAAVNFLVPAGCSADPPGRLGAAALLAEMMTRGAGGRDSRQLAEAFDDLGADHDEGVGPMNMRFSAAGLSRDLPELLALYADILLRPRLPEEELEPLKDLALQGLQALEDAPQQKVMVEMRRRLYPDPLNKDRLGTADGINATDIGTIRGLYERGFRAGGCIMSVAGNFAWGELRDRVGELFGGWAGDAPGRPEFGPNNLVRGHIEQATSQTQIILGWPSVPLGDGDYYAARGAVSVLSGGMSSRLFNEVREKRGLCYSVQAFHETLKGRGGIFCYAGTTTKRAQETLDVTLGELHRLKDGVLDDEVDRARAGVKSALIMQEESTNARAAAIASDWYLLGRVRPPEEIQAAIDALTPGRIIEYLERHPVAGVSALTLGEEPLDISRLT